MAISWIVLAALMQASAGNGAASDANPMPSSLSKDPGAVALATDMGTVVGLARHCDFDPTLIEEYLVAAQARINETARSSTERIMARIQLENFASLGEAKGPEESCEAFRDEFDQRLRARR